MTVPAFTAEAPVAVELHSDRGHVTFSGATHPHDVEQWLESGGADVLRDVPTLDVSIDEEGGSLEQLLVLAESLRERLTGTQVRVSASVALVRSRSEPSPSPAPRSDGAQERRTLLTTKTLRSGTLIRFDGDVTIIGDVHSGAEVIATGNVSVLGKLSGMAHAGCDGDTACFVFALHLEPTQIRIAQHISVLSEGGAGGPQMARLDGDEVTALPLTPRPYTS